MRCSPARFCSLVKGWHLNQFPNTEEGQQAAARWQQMLDEPLPGETRAMIEPSAEDIQADADLFFAAASGR